MSRRGAFVLFGGLLLVSACAAAPDAAAPVAQSQPASKTADAAATPPSAAGGAYQVPHHPTAPPSPYDLDPLGRAAHELDRAERDVEQAILGRDDAGQPLSAGVDRCEAVCSALASMRRSAEHVCELDGSRCVSARERVGRAEERVRSACSTCSGVPT